MKSMFFHHYLATWHFPVTVQVMIALPKVSESNFTPASPHWGLQSVSEAGAVVLYIASPKQRDWCVAIQRIQHEGDLEYPTIEQAVSPYACSKQLL